MISEHVTEWLGFPVKLYDPATKPDYENTVYRIASEWEEKETQVEKFARFLDGAGSEATPAIIFGLFGEHDTSPQPVIEALVAARNRLPNLKAIFLGDILSEENEISW